MPLPLRSAVPAVSLFFMSGCATSLAPITAAQTVVPEEKTQLGFKTSTFVDVSVFETTVDLALGFESQWLEPIEDGTHFGDWRLQGLLGLSQMPRVHEPWVGYEIFLTPGLARYHSDSSPKLGFIVGLLGGLPLRLNRPEPRWRADDVVGIQYYVVPALGTNVLGFEQVDVTASLSFRMHFWSAITP